MISLSASAQNGVLLATSCPTCSTYSCQLFSISSLKSCGSVPSRNPCWRFSGWYTTRSETRARASRRAFCFGSWTMNGFTGRSGPVMRCAGEAPPAGAAGGWAAGGAGGGVTGWRVAGPVSVGAPAAGVGGATGATAGGTAGRITGAAGGGDDGLAGGAAGRGGPAGGVTGRAAGAAVGGRGGAGAAAMGGGACRWGGADGTGGAGGVGGAGGARGAGGRADANGAGLVAATAGPAGRGGAGAAAAACGLTGNTLLHTAQRARTPPGGTLAGSTRYTVSHDGQVTFISRAPRSHRAPGRGADRPRTPIPAASWHSSSFRSRARSPAPGARSGDADSSRSRSTAS